MELITISKKYDWNIIESELQSVYANAPSNVQKSIMPHAYVPGAWKFTTSVHDKRPCICCGELESQMAVLYQTLGLRGIEPVCLCLDHFKEFKNDPRTAKRIKEENQKAADRAKQSAAEKRPRNPDGWQADAEDLVDEINRTLETIRLDVPALIGLEHRECLDKLRSLNTIKKLLTDIQDEARTGLYLQGMKRPETAAYSPTVEA